ncbi:MAG TPA: glycosyltransferase [Flavobacteriales bacterium]|nr:glycosyltransferase [Flavobacteriales bacterium]
MRPVSVLLPVHNSAGTLDAAIASMAAQTFTDWELLLIDNASTDEGPVIARHWADGDPRIRLLREPTIGIAHALNTGLAQAQGKYIARMDADDVSHPARLAEQVAYLEVHPEIGVLGTRTSFTSSVHEHRGMQAFVEWQNGIITPHEHYVKRLVDAPLAHPTAMFRQELVERHGGYSTGPLPEDHELWLRWMDAGVRFAKLPEELLTWSDHARRLSRTHANYSAEAFFATKVRWLAKWLLRTLNGRPVIVAGTSKLCRERAMLLEAEGIAVHAYTDVKVSGVPGYAFIPHDQLPHAGEAFIVSFISQRGTGDRIAEYLASRGLMEGADFILAA